MTIEILQTGPLLASCEKALEEKRGGYVPGRGRERGYRSRTRREVERADEHDFASDPV